MSASKEQELAEVATRWDQAVTIVENGFCSSSAPRVFS